MSSALSLEQTMSELVVQKPSRGLFFESYGLDYCCGGKRTLAEACRVQNLNPDTVLSSLQDFDSQSQKSEVNYSNFSITQIIDHLLETHHVYTRETLELLNHLVDKVTDRHQAVHPELIKIQAIFREMRLELLMHLQKEEQVLFPYARQIDSQTDHLPSFHCGSIQNPISVMMFEHDTTGETLAKLRILTNQYQSPEDACNSYRAMMEGLSALEYDLHQHIHKENNLLFPKILQKVNTLEPKTSCR
jgi:regulator of cell morphogenesis and NO signaling